jgi:hypothetical protein
MKTGARLKNRQGGAVAVMVGISMVMLIGFLALVIDLGRLYLAKTGLQNAADAAALSGAKQLDGTGAGICCGDGSAVYMATHTAGLNTFFGNLGQETVDIGTANNSNPNITFSHTPNGSWVDINTAMASPGDKYFIKVDTASGNLQALFAPVWAAIGGGISTMGTTGLAVAGSYPPGSLTPIFVPVIRRNAPSQIGDTPCSGAIFNDKDYKNYDEDPPSNCPKELGGVDPTNYRKPDYSGNWGFLKAGQCREYKVGSSDEFTANCSSVPPEGIPEVATAGAKERGSYYVIAPRANNKWQTGDPYVWQVGAAWTGNFGFMLKSDDEKTQKSIMAALCRGGGVTAYSVPGCGEVHPGQLSGPKTAANLNTRFDLQSNQTQLSHDLCPSDTNIYSPSGGAWDVNGYLTGYQAGSPFLAPTQYPPGKANRRIIRVYVVDNTWLPGYNDASPNDDSCTINASKKTLTGGSELAHLVGCAEFFMWKPANNQGVIYAEYVRKVPVDQCNASPATFTEIRLYR